MRLQDLITFLKSKQIKTNEKLYYMDLSEGKNNVILIPVLLTFINFLFQSLTKKNLFAQLLKRIHSMKEEGGRRS